MFKKNTLSTHHPTFLDETGHVSLKMSRFTHKNCGHFWALASHLTFHNVKNRGGGGAEREPGRIAGNEEQKKTKKTTHRGKPRQTENNKERYWEWDKQHSPCFFGESRRRVFTQNTACARSGVYGTANATNCHEHLKIEKSNDETNMTKD